MNGKQIAEKNLNMPRNATIIGSYIGGGDRIGALNPKAIYDDFKIYEGAMQSPEIFNDFMDTGVHLTNYWPMSNLTDLVGKSNLIGSFKYNFRSQSYLFESDRFNNPKSAICLQGFLPIRPSIFSKGDLTVTFWFKFEMISNRNSVNILGHTWNMLGSDDTVLLKMEKLKLVAGNGLSTIRSSMKFKFYKWYHIAYVLQNTKAHIYVNGELNVSGELYAPKKSVRSLSLIGGFEGEYLVLDDLKIYQGAMLSEQVLNDYNLSKPSLPSN